MRTGQRKRVQCFSHGPLSVGPQYDTPWEDVWLRWKGKPGRTVHRSAPCLQSYDDLEGERRFQQWGLARNPDLDYAEDIAYSDRMLEAVARDGYAVDDYDCPNVYTRAKTIDRAEAERMLAFLLRVKHGIVTPIFIWRKPKGFAMPVTFAGINLDGSPESP